MTHRNKRWAALIITSLLPLTACGGSDFTGTYEGTVVRTDTRTQTSASSVETWTIVDGEDGYLTRQRGAERCRLNLEFGTCSEGCFNQVILAGQTCTMDGASYTLESGLIDSGNASDDAVTVALSWTSATGETAAVTEAGTLVLQ